MIIFRKEATKKISRNKKLLENKLKVKIEIKGNDINLEGGEFSNYIAEKVLEALEKNFPVNVALLLTKENYMLEDIPIKNITKRKNLNLIRSRIIGTRGKTLKLISELSGCYVQLNDNIVSIIGETEKIKDTINAVKSLILGRKQANVYKYLERQRKKQFLEDLGLIKE